MRSNNSRRPEKSKSSSCRIWEFNISFLHRFETKSEKTHIFLYEEKLQILGSPRFLSQRQTSEEHSTEVAKLKEEQKSQKDMQARLLPEFHQNLQFTLASFWISKSLGVFQWKKKIVWPVSTVSGYKCSKYYSTEWSNLETCLIQFYPPCINSGHWEVPE